MADAFISKRRVLVVEEDSSVRDMMSDIYAFWGACVSFAGPGDAALGAAGLAAYNLVVLSWDFDAVCPLQVVSRIEALRPRGPGLILTTARGPAIRLVVVQACGGQLPVILMPFALEVLRLASRATMIRTWVTGTAASDPHQLTWPLSALLPATGANDAYEAA